MTLIEMVIVWALMALCVIGGVFLARWLGLMWAILIVCTLLGGVLYWKWTE